jgi:hypothetical protein
MAIIWLDQKQKVPERLNNTYCRVHSVQSCENLREILTAAAIICPTKIVTAVVEIETTSFIPKD